MKRLSVIIPVFNAQDYIQRCLEHLIYQLDENDEIIIINDGSTDRSLEICHELETLYPILRVYSIENSGPSHARNIGINKADGKYVIFIDADDVVANNYVKKMLEQLSVYDLVVCGYRLINEDSHKIQNIGMEHQVLEKTNFDRLVFNHLMLNTLWNKAYHLEIIKEKNIRFNEKMFRGEDLLFNLDYISEINTSIFIYSDLLYDYVMKSEGLNLGYRETIKSRFERVKLIHHKMLKISSLNKAKVYQNTVRMYIRHIYIVLKSVLKKLLK